MSNYTFSYWEKTSLLARADYLVIGAGLTGLQTALAIKKQAPTADIVVLERGPFSRGASTRNAGFSCFGSPTELLEDLESTPAETVWTTVASRYAGTQRLAENYGPLVDYQQQGGYEVFYDAAQYERVLSELPMLNEALEAITGQRDVWHPVATAAGIAADVKLLHNRLEGQLHPGLLVQHLERLCHQAGIRLLFGVEVLGVQETETSVDIQLSAGSFAASQVIFTTNAFTPALLPGLDIVPARNQVLITRPIPGLQLRGCFHRERGYVYFRNVGKDRLLIGGARHLAKAEENTEQFGENPYLIEALLADLRRSSVYKIEQSHIETSWSGIIAQGKEKSPILQRISPRQVVAARLAGMGVALSAEIGERAAALVVEQKQGMPCLY